MRTKYTLLICILISFTMNIVRTELSTSPTWRCPEIAQQPTVECSCDMPHTLRCTGNRHAMQIIGRKLRSLSSPASVSLLDCTVQNVSTLTEPLLEGVTLHGLVVSSGEIKDVHKRAFTGLAGPLQALGLPNNQLSRVPTDALAALPALDRLDLSHNLLETLDNTSFLGLTNLSFLDLSDNKLNNFAINAFNTLPQLRILRLRGNMLKMTSIGTLNLPTGISDLDLSSNNLIGPLSPDTLLPMPTLTILQLSHNALSSVRRGALKGFPNLTALLLHHNQIDVLEDHAFEHLSTLTQLDLSHNRIVAVSGASLAHLTKLIELDLGHNFLRALTADLILPLTNLKDLNLDENDISIVASDALKPSVHLRKLTLLDNPLNCDCSLIEFATWLVNSSTLSSEDKATAVCTTPPFLENGLLTEIPIDQFLCGEDEHEPLMAPPDNPIPNIRAKMVAFSYDNKTVSLDWFVESDAIPYTCDTLFIYEDQGFGEVLIYSSKIVCSSNDFLDAHKFNITVPTPTELKYGHQYRYCVALFEGGSNTDEMLLALGCTDIISLEYTAPVEHIEYPPPVYSYINSVTANISSRGNILVNVNITGSNLCMLDVAILDRGSLITQRQINCSESQYIFQGYNERPYRVCVSVAKKNYDSVSRPHCVTAQNWSSEAVNQTNVILLAICITLLLIVIGLVCTIKKFLTKPKIQTHQYFLPPNIDEQQHSRYVKLQATTKL